MQDEEITSTTTTKKTPTHISLWIHAISSVVAVTGAMVTATAADNDDAMYWKQRRRKNTAKQKEIYELCVFEYFTSTLACSCSYAHIENIWWFCVILCKELKKKNTSYKHQEILIKKTPHIPTTHFFFTITGYFALFPLNISNKRRLHIFFHFINSWCLFKASINVHLQRKNDKQCWVFLCFASKQFK